MNTAINHNHTIVVVKVKICIKNRVESYIAMRMAIGNISAPQHKVDVVAQFDFVISRNNKEAAP